MTCSIRVGATQKATGRLTEGATERPTERATETAGSSVWSVSTYFGFKGEWQRAADLSVKELRGVARFHHLYLNERYNNLRSATPRNFVNKRWALNKKQVEIDHTYDCRESMFFFKNSIENKPILSRRYDCPESCFSLSILLKKNKFRAGGMTVQNQCCSLRILLKTNQFWAGRMTVQNHLWTRHVSNQFLFYIE